MDHYLNEHAYTKAKLTTFSSTLIFVIYDNKAGGNGEKEKGENG